MSSGKLSLAKWFCECLAKALYTTDEKMSGSRCKVLGKMAMPACPCVYVCECVFAMCNAFVCNQLCASAAVLQRSKNHLTLASCWIRCWDSAALLLLSLLPLLQIFSVCIAPLLFVIFFSLSLFVVQNGQLAAGIKKKEQNIQTPYPLLPRKTPHFLQISH